MTIKSAAIVLSLLIAAPATVEAGRGVTFRVRARARLMKQKVRNKLSGKHTSGKTGRLRRIGAAARGKLATMGSALGRAGSKVNPWSAPRRAARANARNERKVARDQAWNDYQSGVEKNSPHITESNYQRARANTSRWARPFSRRLRKMGKGTLKLTRKAAARAAREGDVDGAVRFYNLTAGIKNGRGLTGGVKRRARRSIRKAINGAATTASRGDLEQASAGLRALHEIGSTKAAQKMEKALTKRAEVNNRRFFNSERQGALMSHNMLSLVQHSQAMRGQRPTRRVARAMKKARKNAWKELKNAPSQEAFNSSVELLKTFAIERGQAFSGRQWRRIRRMAKAQGFGAPGEMRNAYDTDMAQRVRNATQDWQQAPAQQEVKQGSSKGSNNLGFYSDVLN